MASKDWDCDGVQVQDEVSGIECILESFETNNEKFSLRVKSKKICRHSGVQVQVQVKNLRKSVAERSVSG